MGTGALLGDEVAMCGVDCLVPRPGANDGVFGGELYLYVTRVLTLLGVFTKLQI